MKQIFPLQTRRLRYGTLIRGFTVPQNEPIKNGRHCLTLVCTAMDAEVFSGHTSGAMNARSNIRSIAQKQLVHTLSVRECQLVNCQCRERLGSP